VGEILAGELHTHPRPAPKHALAYSALTGSLWNPFHGGIDGPGGWWILDEPELHLGNDVIVPDLAGWRREGSDSPPCRKPPGLRSRPIGSARSSHPLLHAPIAR